jgi:hypothetical protein
VQAQLALQLLELVAAQVEQVVFQADLVVAALYMFRLTVEAAEAAATKLELQAALVQAALVLVQPVLLRLTLQTLLVQAAAQLAAQLIQARQAAQAQAAAPQLVL